MKKRFLLLILLNLIVISPIVLWLMSYKTKNPVVTTSQSLNLINKITIHKHNSDYEFYLQKSAKTGQWSVVWNGNTWPANIEAVEQFHKKTTTCDSSEHSPEKNLRDCFEVTFFKKNSHSNFKLNATTANFVFSMKTEVDKSDSSDEAIIISFLDPKIFCHVKDDCQIFKIKNQDSEFGFIKRHGKWFLEVGTFSLEIKNDLIAKLFHEIFSLYGESILQKKDNSQQAFAITVYGKTAVEKVNFSIIDGGEMFFVENEAADIYFKIDQEKFSNISKAIDTLLRFHIFQIDSCTDINVVLLESGEYFNFHDPNNNEKWQFTYSKNGDLKVKEISKDQIDMMLILLQETSSINILPDLPIDNKLFTLSIKESAGNQKVFNFYKYNDKLFVEPGESTAKIEINNSLVPVLFHLIRTNVSKANRIL